MEGFEHEYIEHNLISNKIFFSCFWLQIMAFYEEPQWAVVGDTFPVGCAPQGYIY